MVSILLSVKKDIECEGGGWMVSLVSNSGGYCVVGEERGSWGGRLVRCVSYKHLGGFTNELKSWPPPHAGMAERTIAMAVPLWGGHFTMAWRR